MNGLREGHELHTYFRDKLQPVSTYFELTQLLQCLSEKNMLGKKA